MTTNSKVAIVTAVIAVLGVIGAAAINNWDKLFSRPPNVDRVVPPNSVPPVSSSTAVIDVPARPKNWRLDVFTPTNIRVKLGETISFAASGGWSVGLGLVGPDGREDWCECVVSGRSGAGFKGALGALVGRIGDNGTPFLIGRQRSITVVDEGILFLGSNDNMGPCDRVHRGSCFQDNSGTLQVRIEAR